MRVGRAEGVREMNLCAGGDGFFDEDLALD